MLLPMSEEPQSRRGRGAFLYLRLLLRLVQHLVEVISELTRKLLASFRRPDVITATIPWILHTFDKGARWLLLTPRSCLKYVDLTRHGGVFDAPYVLQEVVLQQAGMLEHSHESCCVGKSELCSASSLSPQLLQ